VVADSQYRFPPGPETNLLWSTLQKLRPANPLNLFPHLAEKYGDAAHYQVGSARDRLHATVYRMIHSHRAKVQCAAEGLTVIFTCV
jgi:hypothetical protein